MSLRLQLLAFGLLTLLLPWAGMRFVQQMETALRSGLEGSLQGSADTVAAALESELARDGTAFPAAVPRAGKTVYAHALGAAPEIDGRRDDWRLGELPGLALDASHTIWAGTHGRFAYVYVDVKDQSVVYQSSPGGTRHGDRVVLLLAGGEAPPLWLLLLTAAPSAFRAQYTEPGSFAPSGRFEDRIVGAWQEASGGFAVEARIPLGFVDDALGVAVIDVDADGSGYAGMVASWDVSGTDAGTFVHRREAVQSMLGQFRRTGDRYRVLDGAGWTVADTGGVVPIVDRLAVQDGGLVESFFRYALRREDPLYTTLEAPPGRLADLELRRALDGEAAVAWYRAGADASAIVAAAVPIRTQGAVRGAVLLEQASDPILTLTNRALLRLVTFTVAVSVIAAVGLLAYASFLSFRIRRLAHAAETALGPRGEINVVLPGRAARDEIGDLTRSFGDLLGRLSEYTEYRRTLTSKLAHELRTPLAIVSTSLDNLEHEASEPSAAPYLERLRDGATRLDSILVAMNAATRIEQAINETEPEDFDLAAVVAACAQAYGDVYRQREIACSVPAGHCMVRGSSELIAQLLDKLVENAASFSPPASRIDIELVETSGELVLSVRNRGPTLPAKMRRELFDSLVSIRDRGEDKEPHLGLGLHIVALIAKFHGGSAEAEDLSDLSGVVFRVRLPRSG
jgi:two-component system, OmpR family, sensor histidine kinase ChvG